MVVYRKTLVVHVFCSRKSFWILLLGAVFVALLAIVLFSRNSEPKYKGTRLDDWAMQLSWSSGKDKEEARHAIKAMGASAVPSLIKMLQKEDSRLDRWMQETFLGAFLMSADVYHGMAADALAELGPVAQGAVPALEKVAARSDWLSQPKAEAALMMIREQPIAPLVEVLANRSTANESNWMWAAAVAGELGDNARPLVPLLLGALNDTNAMFRYEAAMRLGQIGLEPQLVIPALARGRRKSCTNAD
jgi:HEAT repeat protein